MFFLEDKDGLILMADNGLTDDLDHGELFPTIAAAEKRKTELSPNNTFEILQNISE